MRTRIRLCQSSGYITEETDSHPSKKIRAVEIVLRNVYSSVYHQKRSTCLISFLKCFQCACDTSVKRKWHLESAQMSSRGVFVITQSGDINLYIAEWVELRRMSLSLSLFDSRWCPLPCSERSHVRGCLALWFATFGWRSICYAAQLPFYTSSPLHLIVIGLLLIVSDCYCY